MISGVTTTLPERRRAWRALWRGACVALALAGAAGGALAFELADLMALLAQQRSGEATFTEQRFVQGLDAPLESSGTLSFTAPDRFVRRTLKPRAESMAVEGNTLTLSRGSRSRSVALDAMPEMVALVEAVRGTLSGDAKTLARYFRTSLAGSAAQWTLDLEPLDRRLAGQVQSVRIAGRQGELSSLQMELVGGDRSVMKIEPQRAAPGGPAASGP